ncbi:hypothetical protein HII36_18500 [Nonomuraea sp. NN258]|uniref:hypothetical protein n=1 Tax=Nonomuraea antri TaxID=2730852 RepID=UPI00156803AA|nr:hypothetical protein [Nonomuraea antri]NRQ33827.1 hypothetical protein [Nonomuraea antri]
MPDNPPGQPPVDQWDLLCTFGFSTRFAGTWVENEDPHEVARQLGVDPATRLDCDLRTAMRSYEPWGSDEIIWIGAHGQGWTHLISISGPVVAPGPPSANGRRLFFVEYDDDEGVHGLSYWRDGEPLGQYGDGGELGPMLVHHGIDLASAQSEADEMNAYLTLVGLATGRFVDSGLLSETRTLYRLSS